MSSDPHDTKQPRSIPVAKVVIAGDGRTGKTSLIRRYCTGMFQESRVMTIGVDFQTKEVDVDGRVIKLSIWDIGGQDRFEAFRDAFYRGAKAVALVYDVTDWPSLNNLPRWYAEIRKVMPQARFIVVGNKTDLHRVVPRDRAKAWTNEQHLPYCETSALTGDGVDLFFKALAWLALQGV
jgi:small GTP-binding protein